jgi:hypothetical protein
MSAVPSPSSSAADLGDEKAGVKTGVPSRRIADEELPGVIARYLKGEVISDMAAEFGVTKKALYKRLHKFMLASDGESGFSDLITQSLAQRIAESDQELEGAQTQVEVSKWSQLGKFARMDFERKRPGLYGAKPVTVNFQTAVVDSALAESMQALLDRVVPQEKVIDADLG